MVLLLCVASSPVDCCFNIYCWCWCDDNDFICVFLRVCVVVVAVVVVLLLVLVAIINLLLRKREMMSAVSDRVVRGMADCCFYRFIT